MKLVLTIFLIISGIYGVSSQHVFEILCDKLIKLLNSCFNNRLKTVVTTPDLSAFFHEAMWESNLFIPIVVIDTNYNLNLLEYNSVEIGSFVLPAKSKSLFKSLLSTVKSSAWWNDHALFIIVGMFHEGCKPAADILEYTWKLNLLSTLFLCYDEDEGVMLFTYNYYGISAPYPWEKIENQDMLNDRWSLYGQKYSEDREICASLDFNNKHYQMDMLSKNLSILTPERVNEKFEL